MERIAISGILILLIVLIVRSLIREHNLEKYFRFLENISNEVVAASKKDDSRVREIIDSLSRDYVALNIRLDRKTSPVSVIVICHDGWEKRISIDTLMRWHKKFCPDKKDR